MERVQPGVVGAVDSKFTRAGRTVADGSDKHGACTGCIGPAALSAVVAGQFLVSVFSVLPEIVLSGYLGNKIVCEVPSEIAFGGVDLSGWSTPMRRSVV